MLRGLTTCRGVLERRRVIKTKLFKIGSKRVVLTQERLEVPLDGGHSLLQRRQHVSMRLDRLGRLERIASKGEELFKCLTSSMDFGLARQRLPQVPFGFLHRGLERCHTVIETVEAVLDVAQMAHTIGEVVKLLRYRRRSALHLSE